MSSIEFKRRPCHPLESKGQRPHPWPGFPQCPPPTDGTHIKTPLTATSNQITVLFTPTEPCSTLQSCPPSPVGGVVGACRRVRPDDVSLTTDARRPEQCQDGDFKGRVGRSVDRRRPVVCLFPPFSESLMFTIFLVTIFKRISQGYIQGHV